MTSATAPHLPPEVLDEIVERVALRVAELLREDHTGPLLLSAAQVAQRLGRSSDWVYDHQAELGAIRLGDGPRPRLGFPSERVAAYSTGSAPFTGESDVPKRVRRRSPRRSSGQRPDLLPIRGGRAR